ncbi:hypothetical protein Sm713_41050 [Streptomyces sp. TS71-3]|nr:hypothetical protein Sm713_41050 [Streptomyces sp. TS71-3]
MLLTLPVAVPVTGLREARDDPDDGPAPGGEGGAGAPVAGVESCGFSESSTITPATVVTVVRTALRMVGLLGVCVMGAGVTFRGAGPGMRRHSAKDSWWTRRRGTPAPRSA